MRKLILVTFALLGLCCQCTLPTWWSKHRPHRRSSAATHPAQASTSAPTSALATGKANGVTTAAINANAGSLVTQEGEVGLTVGYTWAYGDGNVSPVWHLGRVEGSHSVEGDVLAKAGINAPAISAALWQPGPGRSGVASRRASAYPGGAVGCWWRLTASFRALGARSSVDAARGSPAASFWPTMPAISMSTAFSWATRLRLQDARATNLLSCGQSQGKESHSSGARISPKSRSRP